MQTHETRKGSRDMTTWLRMLKGDPLPWLLEEATVDLDVLAGYSAVAVALRFPEVVERGYPPVPAPARVEDDRHVRSMPRCQAVMKRTSVGAHIAAASASELHWRLPMCPP